MSLTWLDMRTCISPELQEIFKAIKFIRRKIEHSRLEIIKEHEKVKRSLIAEAKKKMRQDLRMRPRNSLSSEETREYQCRGIEGEAQLFFHLDSLIIDLKREIEFTLKFIAQAHKIKFKRFSLESIIEQLKPDYKGPVCDFINFMKIKCLIYYDFLSSELTWFSQLNTKRTILIHQGVLNRTDEYYAIFHWPANFEEKEEPSIQIAEISMFKHPVPIWIEFQINKLDQFLKKSFEVNDYVLEYQTTLKRPR